MHFIIFLSSMHQFPLTHTGFVTVLLTNFLLYLILCYACNFKIMYVTWSTSWNINYSMGMVLLYIMKLTSVSL